MVVDDKKNAVRGVLSVYANSNLIFDEKNAWAIAAAEKHSHQSNPNYIIETRKVKIMSCEELLKETAQLYYDTIGAFKLALEQNANLNRMLIEERNAREKLMQEISELQAEVNLLEDELQAFQLKTNKKETEYYF